MVEEPIRLVAAGDGIKRGRDDEGGAQCIHRTVRIMRLLASGSPQGMKLTDIAARLDLSHPTAHRILKALEREGVVERAGASRRYTIGSELVWLGLNAYSRFPITRAAAASLDWLVEEIGDSLFLAVRSGLDSVYADRRLGAFPVQATGLAIGARRPLGVAVGGRAILGFLPERTMDAVISANAGRYEDFGCAADIIVADAQRARRQGFAIADSVTAPDRRVLAVPVLDMAGAPVASLSVIAVRRRLSDSRAQNLVALLRRAAQEISDVLSRQKIERTRALAPAAETG